MRTAVKGWPLGRLEIVILAALGTVLSACTAGRYQTAAPLDEAARVVMEQTTQQALEDNPDGQSSNWSIPESGHVGTVVPTRTFQTGSGQSCREFQQTVAVGGTTRAAYGTACRKTDGGWQRVDYTGLADVRSYGTAYGYRYPHYRPDLYYGHRPYYPRSSFGVFFGHGHHYRHRRHHGKHHGHRGHRRHPDR